MYCAISQITSYLYKDMQTKEENMKEKGVWTVLCNKKWIRKDSKGTNYGGGE
jgi:hypothetical protein